MLSLVRCRVLFLTLLALLIPHHPDRIAQSLPQVAPPREQFSETHLEGNEEDSRTRKPSAEVVKRKLENLQRRNSALEREIEEERLRAEELAAKLTQTSKALSEKQTKLSQSEQYVHALEDEKDMLAHKVSEISGELQKNVGQWNTLKATVKETETHWRQQLEETERMTMDNTERLAKDIETQTGLIETLRTEISDLETLKTELARKIRDWDQMNSELDNVKEANGELRAQLERFQEQLIERTASPGPVNQAQPLALELWTPGDPESGQLVPAQAQLGRQTMQLADELEDERNAHKQTREEMYALAERIFGMEDALKAQEERVQAMREESGFQQPSNSERLWLQRIFMSMALLALIAFLQFPYRSPIGI
ncbi:hypothetical protein HDU93_004586 [Gonapodya sp. JEL0774]|nr:hypothetical protein HDU93_004586 [Gonapodya sp. JEL0774]